MKGVQEDGEKDVDEIKKGKVKLPVCLIKHHATNVYGGTGGIALSSLNVGSRWMGVASIKPRPIYFRQKCPRYPWVRGQVGSRAGLEVTEKKNLMSPGFKIRFLICPVRSLATIPTELPDSQ